MFLLPPLRKHINNEKIQNAKNDLPILMLLIHRCCCCGSGCSLLMRVAAARGGRGSSAGAHRGPARGQAISPRVLEGIVIIHDGGLVCRSSNYGRSSSSTGWHYGNPRRLLSTREEGEKHWKIKRENGKTVWSRDVM